jgi:iron complex outermembrane receptor protein
VAAPIDIIGGNELREQPSPDITNDLRVLVPSLNVNDNPISGTSAGIRPVELRGLSPDATLVLINGKRMGRSADIPTFSGGLSDGSQSPDMSIMPSIALKQVQVLRDGAAAQYGADAIAGVVNFIMNDSPTGGTVQGQFGSTYAGDGNTYQIAGTYGTHLGAGGFIREVLNSAATTGPCGRCSVPMPPLCRQQVSPMCPIPPLVSEHRKFAATSRPS